MAICTPRGKIQQGEHDQDAAGECGWSDVRYRELSVWVGECKTTLASKSRVESSNDIAASTSADWQSMWIAAVERADPLSVKHYRDSG